VHASRNRGWQCMRTTRNNQPPLGGTARTPQPQTTEAPPCRAAWFLAGLFCVLTLTVTLYEVALHLEYYSRPALQRHIIRILLMPPIYALDAWFCLRFANARTVLTPIRESYEAYTIYNFFMYLIRYLEGQLGPVQEYMGGKGTTVPHIWPVNYLSHPWVGREMHHRCRSGVLNYVILRPVTAVVMWATLVYAPERYEEGAPPPPARASPARSEFCMRLAHSHFPPPRHCLRACCGLAPTCSSSVMPQSP
jgi:Organic solute transporter Ostalpha